MTGASRSFMAPYTGKHLAYVSMPMGGLGAGNVCLAGNGAIEYTMWRHRSDFAGSPQLFAAISLQQPTVVAKSLQGPVPDWKVFGHPRGGYGRMPANHGLPHCREATFTDRFPFGDVQLSDPLLPLDIRLTGWSPFVPGDEDASSLPVAGLEYHFTNTGSESVEAVFSFHAANPIRYLKANAEDADPAAPSVRRLPNGVVFSQPGKPGHEHHEGHAAVFLLNEPDAAIDAAWFRGAGFDTPTMVWNSIAAGEMPDRAYSDDFGTPSPGASLYVPVMLKPGESRTIRVLIAWYVPYSDLHVEATPAINDCPLKPIDCYRPWYAGVFQDVDAVATAWARDYEELRRRSALFAEALLGSDLPPEVLEAVSCNLAILKSPTVLRQLDSRLWGWEGCHHQGGSCHGTCTHVWNYAQAIAHLFPNLERTLRETEFLVAQDETGFQTFRTPLPIRPSWPTPLAACDGQLGGILKVFRDWHICGDDAWLRQLWPAVRRSMDYCIETWDPHHTGHLTEPHHNTYDIEFWGPDGMCMSFYLAALQAAAQMADAMGDGIPLYTELLTKGVAFTEQELFDGEYFIQKLDWSETDKSPLDEGTNLFKLGYSPEAKALLNREGPKYQYGQGCLSDGVVGEFLAWASGLPPVLASERLRSHLCAVHRYNLRHDLSDYGNPQRPGFAVDAEAGLLLCTWPKGGALSLPFAYSSEVWTGIEYQVAAHLFSLGEVEKGLEIVRACRRRYDGRRRNPYDEYECGHWYARALASYALLQGLTGLRYDARDQVLYLQPRLSGDFRCFLSTQSGFGVAGIRDGVPFCQALDGEIVVQRFEVLA